MKKILISGFVLFSLFSCEDYLDVNEDQQNRADFEKIAPNQMLAAPILAYGTHQNVTLNDFGNRMSYAWGLNSGFTSNDPAFDFKFNSSSYNGLFNTTFLVADNFQDILDKKDQFPNHEYHFAIAKIFKVMLMDYATALYGDIPYFQAFKDDVSYPKYDDDKAIIPALFDELDEARAMLSTTNPAVVALGSEDVLFGGDTAKWEQFLNTVELRLALRLSKTTDVNLVALRNARFASLPDNFITSDVSYNPGYSIAVGFRNPVYTAWALDDALAAFTSANRAMAAGDFAARLVNGTMNDANITTGIVDPRRARIFTTIGGVVVGNVHGVFPTTAISRFSNFYIGRIGSDENGASRDAYMMQAAEAYFLKAEAIERGYMAGSAQTEFNNGITASFNFNSRGWNLGSSTPATVATLNPAPYITSIDTRNGLGWTASTDKISAIATQKYLALANWNGIELYINHLRTGFPVLPFPVNVTRTTRPLRMVYPSREYSTNSENVPSVTLEDLFTNNALTPYYLQN